MSDDEVDLELLELLRQSLGVKQPSNEISCETGVLRDAEFIYNNSIDVFIDMYGTKAAAAAIYANMRARNYSPAAWSTHELHPSMKEGFTEVDIVNFVFTMDLLNFSFWSEFSPEQRYQVEYRGKRWTGYNSLVACLRRALDEGIPITTPRFWRSQTCTDKVLAHVFRSATAETIPLLEERICLLRETSEILCQKFSEPEEDDDGINEKTQVEDEVLPDVKDEIRQHESPSNAAEAENVKGQIEGLIQVPTDALSELQIQTSNADPSHPHHPQSSSTTDTSETIPSTALLSPRPDTSILHLLSHAQNSSGKLTNLLTHHFPHAFLDTATFSSRRVRLLKRAQIFGADLWAALEGKGAGRFDDIGDPVTGLTMFADYRVPQMLCNLGVLSYSPPLNYHIRDGKMMESGGSWEVQLRGCSIWAVELIRREILRAHPEVNEEVEINAVLIDFFLYDLAKEREGQADMPHHRTRSIWY